MEIAADQGQKRTNGPHQLLADYPGRIQDNRREQIQYLCEAVKKAVLTFCLTE